MTTSIDNTLPILVPLLPKITFLDILLPPILISTSLLLHTLYNSPLPSSSDSNIRSHLYHATTSHARFVPLEAKHIFSYPVIFIGVDLNALEKKELDLDGRWFSWEPKKWSLLALRSEGYLDLPSLSSIDSISNKIITSSGIKQRLLNRLSAQGIDTKRAELVYMVTMPAYLGLEGINPLTIHFCYTQDSITGIRGKLEVVVLEVHNTFGERHIYILETNKEEDDLIPDTWEHRWTFPRAFHVSPFNDRQGFYRVSLSDPLKSTNPSQSLPTNPHLSLKILFLTPSPDDPTILQKKIYASLSGPSSPLTPSSILRAVMKWPFSLLLTTPRILYQALILHYSKKLNVYPRPEPFVGLDEDGEVYTLEGKLNPVEKGGKKGSVGWQESGAGDEYAKERLVQFLGTRTTILSESEKRNFKITIKSANDSVKDILITSSPISELPIELLTIYHLTPQFYTDLLIAPTIPLALSLNNNITHRWKTTNDSLFLSLFTISSSSLPSYNPSFFTRINSSLRLLIASPIHSNSNKYIHPLDIYTSSSTLSLTRFLMSHYFWFKVGYWIFKLTGAKFVEGTDSFSEWKRLKNLIEKEKEKDE